MLLGSPGAARPRHTVLTGKGGASGRVILQPAFQVALLVILLVHKLMVLQKTQDREGDGETGCHKKKSREIYSIYIYVHGFIYPDIFCFVA